MGQQLNQSFWMKQLESPAPHSIQEAVPWREEGRDTRFAGFVSVVSPGFGHLRTTFRLEAIALEAMLSAPHLRK